MQNAKPVSKKAAKQLGDALGIDWRTFGVDEFRLGLQVEAEEVAWDTEANIAFDDAFAVGKVTLQRLSQNPAYYSHQRAMEQESDAYWADI